jgi:heavy metal sensor kinase
MKRLNVRWRLTLWYGAVLTVILVGFGACVFVMMQRHLLARTDFELDEELTELALEVRLATSDEDLREQLERRFFRHASFDFQVSRLGQPPLFRSEHLQDVALPAPNRDASGDALATVSETHRLPVLGEMRVVSRRASGQGDEYLVQATMSLLPNHAELQAMLTMMLIAGPLALLAALVGGYFLARRSLAPVDRMATTAEQITGMRLDARIEVENPDDELGHLARTFNSMLDRLQRAVDELRRFTADAAHELRTPISVMQAEAEVALRQARSADEYRRVIEVTLDESKRMGRLADRLLTLCRHDSGLQPMRHEEVQFDALVRDVVDQVRVTAQDKGLELVIAPLAECVIVGDDIQLSQLLFNLLDNAVKFTKPGGKVKVEVHEEQHNGHVQLVISDTGIGIPHTDLPHVFERFYRADKSRNGQTGGAGLGLAISKAIVEAHHGSIAIDSTLNAGTVVRVKLPVMPPAEAALSD